MPRSASSAQDKLQRHAEVFAALGDPKRLAIVGKLLKGQARSIADLTDGLKVTRQAVTKHLRVLQDVGVVHHAKRGRETLYELEAGPLEDLREYLGVIAAEWDQTLNALKAFVEQK